jgi:hypothetical protein
MSGTLTVQGASHSGIVPIPTDFPDRINALLSSYLDGLSGSIAGGTAGFENVNIVSGNIEQTSVSASGLEEFTNTDSIAGSVGGGNGSWNHGHDGSGSGNQGRGNDNKNKNAGPGNHGQGNHGQGSDDKGNDGKGNHGQGGQAWGGQDNNDTASGSFTVNASASTVIVSAPGDETIQGNGVTNVAIFGATSNVNYTDMNGGSAMAADSIFAAGGNDSITTYSTTNTGSSYQVYSAGNDTINLKNQGTDSVIATGNAHTDVFISQAAATVTATDNSFVRVNETGSGTLDFINNSSNAATVFSSSNTDGAALNAVTAFGGAGGGYYAGGTSGNNSLVGGSGTVTLQGAGNNDFLEANSSVGTNLLMAGAGNETLLGSSTSGSNTFQVGLSTDSANGAIVSNGVVSTDGNGIQTFILGNSDSTTLTGSNAAGALNIYDVVRDSATEANGPSNFTITDFSSNSALFITDSTPGAGAVSITAIGNQLGGGGAEILLSDKTTINLTGVSASSIIASTDSNGTIRIT